MANAPGLSLKDRIRAIFGKRTRTRSLGVSVDHNKYAHFKTIDEQSDDTNEEFENTSPEPNNHRSISAPTSSVVIPSTSRATKEHDKFQKQNKIHEAQNPYNTKVSHRSWTPTSTVQQKVHSNSIASKNPNHFSENNQTLMECEHGSFYYGNFNDTANVPHRILKTDENCTFSPIFVPEYQEDRHDIFSRHGTLLPENNSTIEQKSILLNKNEHLYLSGEVSRKGIIDAHSCLLTDVGHAEVDDMDSEASFTVHNDEHMMDKCIQVRIQTDAEVRSCENSVISRQKGYLMDISVSNEGGTRVTSSDFQVGQAPDDDCRVEMYKKRGDIALKCEKNDFDIGKCVALVHEREDTLEVGTINNRHIDGNICEQKCNDRHDTDVGIVDVKFCDNNNIDYSIRYVKFCDYNTVDYSTDCVKFSDNNNIDYGAVHVNLSVENQIEYVTIDMRLCASGNLDVETADMISCHSKKLNVIKEDVAVCDSEKLDVGTVHVKTCDSSNVDVGTSDVKSHDKNTNVITESEMEHSNGNIKNLPYICLVTPASLQVGAPSSSRQILDNACAIIREDDESNRKSEQENINSMGINPIEITSSSISASTDITKRQEYIKNVHNIKSEGYRLDEMAQQEMWIQKPSTSHVIRWEMSNESDMHVNFIPLELGFNDAVERGSVISDPQNYAGVINVSEYTPKVKEGNTRELAERDTFSVPTSEDISVLVEMGTADSQLQSEYIDEYQHREIAEEFCRKQVECLHENEDIVVGQSLKNKELVDSDTHQGTDNTYKLAGEAVMSIREHNTEVNAVGTVLENCQDCVNIVDECGLVDAYHWPQNNPNNIHNLRYHPMTIERLQNHLKQLKKEKHESKRQLREISKHAVALRQEAGELRSALSDVCDATVTVMGGSSDPKTLEPTCYKKYLNIRTSSDASKALAFVRSHIKALTDLETLIYRKQLILLQVFPNASHEQTPPPKRTNRPAHKMSKSKRNEQSVSSNASMGNVVIEIVSSTHDNAASWSKEPSHTESPLTISTLLSISNDATASTLLLTDTEV